jgi:hypothetical protein
MLLETINFIFLEKPAHFPLFTRMDTPIIFFVHWGFLSIEQWNNPLDQPLGAFMYRLPGSCGCFGLIQEQRKYWTATCALVSSA